MSGVQQMMVAGNHPLEWEEYVGQDMAKRMLRIAVGSAKLRHSRLEHTLIAHPDPGIGKSSLAFLVALELGTEIEVVSGKVTVDDVRVKLAGMGDGDVLVLEEIHRIFAGGKAGGEWLLHYMQNDVLLGPLGPEDMPKVTIIATTTDVGRVPGPILQRFVNKPVLVRPTVEQAQDIAAGLAEKLFVGADIPWPSNEVCRKVAIAASGRPRVMRDILTKVRDLVMMGELPADAEYPLDEALAWEGLTEDGLTHLCQEYMKTIHGSAARAGIRSIAERMGQMPAALEDTERLLADKGYLERRATGRVLTAAGIQRVKALLRAEAQVA